MRRAARDFVAGQGFLLAVDMFFSAYARRPFRFRAIRAYARQLVGQLMTRLSFPSASSTETPARR